MRACIICGAPVRDDRSSCLRCGGAAVEFAEAGSPAAATAGTFAPGTPVAEPPRTMWTARLLIGLVAAAVAFGGIVVWRALPDSSGSVPGPLKPYVGGQYSIYRNGAFGVHLPKGFEQNRGQFLMVGRIVDAQFAFAQVKSELVEVITGRTAQHLRVGSLRQAGDVAEVMRAAGKVGTGPAFERVALSTSTWRRHPMVSAQWKGPSRQVLGMRVSLVGKRFVIFLALVHGHPDRVLDTLTRSYTAP